MRSPYLLLILTLIMLTTITVTTVQYALAQAPPIVAAPPRTEAAATQAKTAADQDSPLRHVKLAVGMKRLEAERLIEQATGVKSIYGLYGMDTSKEYAYRIGDAVLSVHYKPGVPAAMVVGSGPGAPPIDGEVLSWEYLTPTSWAVRRFKDDIENFQLFLWQCEASGGKHANLVLTVPKYAQANEQSPFAGVGHKKNDEARTVVRISKEQAGKIVDALADMPFFDQARNVHHVQTEPCSIPGLSVTAVGPRYQWVWLFAEMPWRLETLNRLEVLRKVLDGESATAISSFLAPLQAHRAEWEKAAATRPATRPATAPASTPAPSK